MKITPRKIAVVGRGLIGAAAARYLAKAGHAVTLIGPAEPMTPWADHAANFASHYDEGRITRINDRRPFFARAAAAAISRYAEIERTSGISFFTEAGALMAGGPAFMAAVAEGRKGVPVTFDALDADALKTGFPYFAFDPTFTATYEPKNAGYLSPRRLVAAQTRAAQTHGARLIDAEATRVAPQTVTTATQTIHCDEVIVAAGGWTDALLGRKTLSVYARTVALHRIEGLEARRLASMPSIVLDSPLGLYILPPVPYPDGLWLKLGGDPVDVPLATQSEINDWFRAGGSAEIGDMLTDALTALIPNLAYSDRRIAPCVTTWTDNGIPEIRRLAPGLTVAAGGNGAGAKCSDELGRLAAALATEDETETA